MRQLGVLLLALLCLAAGFVAGRWWQPAPTEDPASSPAKIDPAEVSQPPAGQADGNVDQGAGHSPDEDRLQRRMGILEQENRDLSEALQRYKARDKSQDAVRARLRGPLEWLKQLSPKAFAGLTTAELRNMRVLDLSSTKVQDEDLTHLQHLDAVRRLVLRRTSITDAGLFHLRKARSLTHLGLRETRVTDEGMRYLAELRSLKHLDLNMLPVTDAGLAHLQGMTKLEFLRLNFTKITDAGLSLVSKLPVLSRLDLWATKITDAGVEHLWYMKSLRHLELGATPISKEWVERFGKAHPKCYIHSRYGR